jgi:hypothetical protein
VSREERPSGPVSPEPSEQPPVPTRMIRREQQIGYVLAGVAAAGGVSAATTGHDLIVGALAIVGAVLLALAARHGHRIITAFTGFLAGFVLSRFFFPLEIILLVYSGYLMMRTSSAQGKIRRAQPVLSAAERREAAAARAAARAARKMGATGATPATAAVKTPPPNRRYTPPKPKPVRPASPPAAAARDEAPAGRARQAIRALKGEGIPTDVRTDRPPKDSKDAGPEAGRARREAPSEKAVTPRRTTGASAPKGPRGAGGKPSP